MKIVGVAMVKNELDIIEPFVRHNLALVDHLHILLHASVDPSGEILDRLAGEGVAVSVEHEADFVFNKQSRFNAAVASAIERHRPDFVVPFDADEFIAAESRAVLERELARIPRDGWLAVPWTSYVPTEDDDPAEPNPIKRMHYCRVLPNEIGEPVKSFFRAETFADGRGQLTHGQHRLLRADGSIYPRIPAEDLTLAHFPVRSIEQLASKTMAGWLARRVSEDYQPRASHYWNSLNTPLAGRRTFAELRAVAERYHIDEELQNVEVTLRPLRTNAQELRYGALIEVDTLARVYRQAQDLAERLGSISSIVAREGIDSARMNQIIQQRAQALAEREALHEKLLIQAAHIKRRITRRNRTIKILGSVAAVLLFCLALAVYFLAAR